MTELQTVPADFIGEYGIGYVLAARPSPEMVHVVTPSLQGLQKNLPGVVWPMPAETLHSTVCEIVESRPYPFDKETWYADNQMACEMGIAKTLAGMEPFDVHFDTIEASANAVIVRGQDNGTYNELRARLLTHIDLAPGTKLPPPIIHYTIGRYLAKAELATAQNIVAQYGISHTETINSFSLLKTIVRPLLEYETLRIYPLTVKAV
jgi:hypothetical protein